MTFLMMLWSLLLSSGLKEETDRAEERDITHILWHWPGAFSSSPAHFHRSSSEHGSPIAKILTPLSSPHLTCLSGELNSKIARAWISYTYLVEFK